MHNPWHTLALVVCSCAVCFACDDGDAGANVSHSTQDAGWDSATPSKTAISEKLAHFSGSGCRSHATKPRVLITGVADADVPPGACVVSRRQDDRLLLDLLDVRGPCLDDELLRELPWRPMIDEFDSSHIELSVEWPSDKTPACGACNYDFSFEIGPATWSETTDFAFELRPCPKCASQDVRHAKLDTGEDKKSVINCDRLVDDGGAPANDLTLFVARSRDKWRS